MDSYSPLLERTRVPQPSLQSYAVISIFEKLRSAPPHLDPDSDLGRDAITQCLHSTSPSVVDQSVRELCRLVKDSKLDISRGLMELQSALEGSDTRFVNVFVKGLGFLVRLGFQNSLSSFRFHSSEAHPFVKILSCRTEVQSELVQQVVLFMVQNKKLGMVEVCEFLRPFLNFMIIRMSYSTSFFRNLFSSVASVCCLYPVEAMPVIKLLMRCLRYFSCKNAEEISNISDFMKYMVDMFIVVLQHLVGKGLLVHEVQLCCVELLETLFSLQTYLNKCSGGSEAVIEISRSLVLVQKELGLSYIPELSSVVLSLFVTLVQSELEHEQLSILKIVFVLLKWKTENDYVVSQAAGELAEEFLFIYPVINLMSSPSVSVKQAASDLLSMFGKLSINLLTTPKEGQIMQGKIPSISRPGHIFFRLLQHLWFQDQSLVSGSFYLNFTSNGETNVTEIHNMQKTWTFLIKEYSVRAVERRKSYLPVSQSQETFLNEMVLFLTAIASVLVMHHTLGSSAVDLLAVTSNMDPKLGVPLLLVILFYSNMFSGKDKAIDFHDMLLKLLGILPSLASHPAMIPLIVQTILPMLQNDTKPFFFVLTKMHNIATSVLKSKDLYELIPQFVCSMLYATATRLLCKTWEINDRVFGSLQRVLLPKGFVQFKSERSICISMAVCIRDVCKRDPDRGVDLILSVSACIESNDPSIHTLGLLSLAHLCEADVVDFYSAWGVIAKHLLNYSENPVICHGISVLLKWGAMDAEAYPEEAINVVQILWEIGTTRQPSHEFTWSKARASAFEALTHYEVLHIQKSIPDLKARNMELLTAETNPEVLRAMEEFEVKIITYEHHTRQRLVKEKRVHGNKIEKLVDVFPQLIFNQGDNSKARELPGSKARELPGAALFCLPLTPKDVNIHGASKGLQDLHARYKIALLDIAASLHLSRNILIAILSLQSWKAFMRRWIRAHIVLLDAKGSSTKLDNTSKAANDILKRVIQVAEESIPRSAENIALAMGAFCMVLPPSAHAIKSTASKFLLNWLFQYEHEYRQWSAAIALGAISSCLHVSDHKQKFQNINALLEYSELRSLLHFGCPKAKMWPAFSESSAGISEKDRLYRRLYIVASISKSTLVKGACGLGLGFSSQDLLTRVGVEDNSNSQRETYWMQEIGLLGRIVTALSHMLCQFTQSSSDVLELHNLSSYFFQKTDALDSDHLYNNYDDLEEDIWGVAGLVLGLGNSVSAVYRTGNHDAVLKIKTLITSWIPHVNPLVQNSATGEKLEIALSLGSFLALPIIVDFFQRVKMLDDSELDHLISGSRELISELLSINKSGAFHQSLLIASCTGVANLIACILNEGVHSVQVEHVKDLLILFKKSYSSSYPPLIHLGGMLGVVNILGAGAGILFRHYPLTPPLHHAYDPKESSIITGPLFSSPVMEPNLMSLIQDMFLVSQNPDDHQLQQYAAWAVSFLRHYLWFKEVQNEENNFQSDTVGSKSVSHSFPGDSLVMKLSTWLMHHNYPGTGTAAHVNTVATALRCLTNAPRLPLLDWGAIIRRCMRYEDQVAELLTSDSALRRGVLREECLKFSVAHANQFDPLLSFLDELYDLARFQTLELNLQSCMLSRLADMKKIFSGSRIEKLFEDVANFIHWLVSSNQLYNQKQKSLLRVSCWKGLALCFNATSINFEDIPNLENCMKVLFCSLPAILNSATIGVGQYHILEEWSEAIRCLGKARQGWLIDLLQVFEVDFKDGSVDFLEVKKKTQAMARLVQTGSIPLSELGKLKAYMLNTRSQDIWDILLEVAATLQHAEGSIKRQWLLDAAEISCVTSYPSTALQFLSLLCGSFSKYMPFLVVDRFVVLCDLPVTLASLLSETSWKVVAESVVSLLWTLTERIHCWATHMEGANDLPIPQSIDKSEDVNAAFLLRLMHQACVSLKDYLSTEKQLRLANMFIP